MGREDVWGAGWRDLWSRLEGEELSPGQKVRGHVDGSLAYVYPDRRIMHDDRTRAPEP